MAVYTPQELKITPVSTGGVWKQGAWYNGRQYWGGTLSEPNQIHPSSNQVGAGQQVSQEVVAQSAQAQGKTPEQLNQYFADERARSAGATRPSNPAPANFSNAGATGASGASGAGAGFTPAPTINLPEIYKNLYASSGISDIENDYSSKEKAYIEAKGKINDNPFLSEATRVGRVAKLESLFNERTANLKNDIATRKADIETQLNLQTKQFDINSQQAKMALDQFNTLLQAGALTGASGEDIANITRATGISSSMIQSAITASQKKDVKTQVITSTQDDGTVTATVINSETGEIIAKNNLGRIGNQQTGTAKEPKPQTEGEQKASVLSSVNSYLGNESFQAQISPEDLYNKLISTYPEAFDYITTTWTPTQIRIANGENNPYGNQ